MFQTIVNIMAPKSPYIATQASVGDKTRRSYATTYVHPTKAGGKVDLSTELFVLSTERGLNISLFYCFSFSRYVHRIILDL